MNSSSGSPEPEPIENKIALAIQNTLEPFVVSLLAALIAPSQCTQGIDRESDDQRRKAIETGRMLLEETRTRLRDSHNQIERISQELEAQKQQTTARACGGILLCQHEAW